MRPQRIRLARGDLLAVETPNGIAHVQYVGNHPEYGDTIWIVRSPSCSVRSSSHEEVLEQGYFAFYPARMAAAQGLIKKIANRLPPPLPRRLRRAGVRTGRRIDTWIIEDEAGEVVKKSLSSEELNLPIAAIWNHELLVQRLTEGWNPARVEA